jgi:hypothetical protein
VFHGSLRKAFQYFSGRGINMFVRWDRLETDGISPDDEVRFATLEGLKDISLRTALEFLIKAQFPEETNLAYGIDPAGAVVISAPDDVPREYHSVPKFLAPAKEALMGNGFDNPSLIGTVQFMVRNSARPPVCVEFGGFGRGGPVGPGGPAGPAPMMSNGAFNTSSTSVINGKIPLSIRIAGGIGREPESGQVILDLSPLTVKAEDEYGRMLLDLRTSVVVSPGDYLVLSTVPTDPAYGRAIAVVIRVDEVAEKSKENK